MKKKGVERSAVLWWEEKKFITLSTVWPTFTGLKQKYVKHATEQRMRAEADEVLNAGLLYTKYSRNLICAQSMALRFGLAQLRKYMFLCLRKWRKRQQVANTAGCYHWLPSFNWHNIIDHQQKLNRIGIDLNHGLVIMDLFFPRTVSPPHLCVLMLVHS